MDRKKIQELLDRAREMAANVKQDTLPQTCTAEAIEALVGAIEELARD